MPVSATWLCFWRPRGLGRTQSVPPRRRTGAAPFISSPTCAHVMPRHAYTSLERRLDRAAKSGEVLASAISPLVYREQAELEAGAHQTVETMLSAGRPCLAALVHYQYTRDDTTVPKVNCAITHGVVPAPCSESESRLEA